LSGTEQIKISFHYGPFPEYSYKVCQYLFRSKKQPGRSNQLPDKDLGWTFCKEQELQADHRLIPRHEFLKTRKGDYASVA